MTDSGASRTPATERLYYTDAYLSEFTARVADVAEDGRRVYLDRSAFYPTSGGQPHDAGTLGGSEVVDVVDEDERVAHLLATPLIVRQGDVVEGRIDRARRFDHMQQHTGQHLLSAVLEELFFHRTVSVHFGAATSTLDIEGDLPSRERLIAAEERANALIASNLPVTVSFEDASQAAGLRKASEREGTLRIVTIEGIDRSACGGTHVRMTGEIGAIMLRRVEKVRKTARLEFVCGLRAVRRARADYEALGGVATALSAALEDVPTLVAGQAERLRESESAGRRLERELAVFRARELHAAATPDERGRRLVLLERAAGMEELRTLAQALIALPATIVVGTVDGASPGAPPSILLATSEDTGLDAGRTLREVLASSGGRGGGGPRVAQGSGGASGVPEILLALRSLPAEN